MRRSLALFVYAGLSLAQQPDFYESKVLPVLKANCIGCHSEKNLSSGLSLETQESLLRGGNRGAAAMKGNPTASLIIQAVKQDGDLKMPPGRKLKDEQIQVLEQWVKDGVPMPEALVKSRRPGLNHWAWKAPQRAPLPALKDTAWARNPVDHFVLSRLEQAGVKPSPEADRATLLRRASLDLIGLPPTVKELEEFLSDARPDAYERAVERLLASPHYGERWGRLWLDIARYADTDGYTIDAPRPIWKYRDWVIQAFNRDLPFDQFVIEQYAGDLLPNATIDQIIATGFHRNTPSNFEGGIDFEQYRVEAVVDRVSTTGSAFLGLTLGCARCHDHKYDPITQREFYQIFAFLNNTDEVDKEADRKDHNKPFLDLATPEERIRRDAHMAQMKLLETEFEAYEKKLNLSEEARKEDPGWKVRNGNLNELRKREPEVTRTMVVRDLPTPRQAYIHLGGDFLRKGSNVEPAVPSIFPPIKAAGGKPTRLDFARWLVARENPMTARVTVNRIWQKYFGRGFVDTENDFGAVGDQPNNRELLDWLSVEFMERGWSQKALHRLIVTSATYRQASRGRPEVKAVDPDNKLLARQSRLRLDAEIIRDSALIASGLFSDKVGGPSVYPPLPAGANSVTQVQREWKTSEGGDRYRRGIYTYFQRSAAHPGLILFDAPDATVACTRRIRSNSPLQALTLLNDEAYFEFAQALAERVMKEPGDDAARVRHAYRMAVNRMPNSDEQSRLTRILATQRDAKRDEKAAWTAVSRVILNLDEFMTRE